MPELTPTQDGSHTLRAEHGETYHSRFGAVTESRHVFLEASGFHQLVQQQKQVRILEIGFGTGLNCLLSADALGENSQLHYHALERYPVTLEALSSLDYQRHLTHPALWPALLRHWPSLSQSPSTGIWRQQSLSPQCQLALCIDDATQVEFEKNHYDIVYLDAFSPETCPELWTQAFLSRLWHCLRPAGALSTYCAKGQVRRNLIAVGFDVQRLPGPPGKREMLVARHP